jgi:hypothetical protein
MGRARRRAAHPRVRPRTAAEHELTLANEQVRRSSARLERSSAATRPSVDQIGGRVMRTVEEYLTRSRTPRRA